jgi:hypothetical protein
MVAGHRGGLTDPLGFVLVNPEWPLVRVRSLIETTRDRGMLRRSALFEEVMEIMHSSQNNHGYPKEV